jgi:hypothetical protein
MLARRGNKQPAHHDSLPEPREANSNFVCEFCQTLVFQPLINGKEDEADSEVSYSRRTKELHQAVAQGCQWCRIIVYGVLSSAHLDYWFAQWDGSHSDGSSMMDKFQMDEEANEQNLNHSRAEEPEGSEFEDEDGELTLCFADLEKYDGQVDVDLIITGKDVTTKYSELKVTIELAWETGGKQSRLELPVLKNDKAVSLEVEALLSSSKSLQTIP